MSRTPVCLNQGPQRRCCDFFRLVVRGTGRKGMQRLGQNHLFGPLVSSDSLLQASVTDFFIVIRSSQQSIEMYILLYYVILIGNLILEIQSTTCLLNP